MPQPLPLPENYNPQTHLLAKVTENGLFHETRAGASFAHRLVANGAPEDLALAETVLDVVLGCQERRAGDPHHGNFTWMLEDDHVEDLNAVEFNLEHLIPMMIRHADRLSPAIQARVLDAIRLGLDEIRRLDVSVAYTNICLLDVLNTSLGGELLGDRKIAERGYRKLAAWMAFTDSQGIAFEWNSPTYGAVDIRALKLLADLTRDEDTRIRARTAAARMGLSTALHIHAATGRWAGPHGRAYHPSVVCETPPEMELVRGWLADGALPGWIADALDASPAAFEISETAHAGREMGITTYHSPSFVLGTASKEYTGQSDVLMAHYCPARRSTPWRALHALSHQRQVARRLLPRHRPHQVAQPDRRGPVLRRAARAAGHRPLHAPAQPRRDLQRQGVLHLHGAAAGG